METFISFILGIISLVALIVFLVMASNVASLVKIGRANLANQKTINETLEKIASMLAEQQPSLQKSPSNYTIAEKAKKYDEMNK